MQIARSWRYAIKHLYVHFLKKNILKINLSWFFFLSCLIGTCILDSFDLQTNTNMATIATMVTCTIITTTTQSPQTPKYPRLWPPNSPTAKSPSTRSSPVQTCLVPIRTVLTSCVALKDWIFQTRISTTFMNLSP